VAFTVGWPGGSSPVSVADADEYFADRGATGWAGQPAAKQGALTRATDYVKALFAARFNPDLFPVEAGLVTIPDALARAVCEYALVELTTPGGLAPAPAIDASGYAVVKTKKKVGPIETNFAIAGGDSAVQRTRKIFPVPDALIASLLLPSQGYSRTTR
jgi:hypothetical protein